MDAHEAEYQGAVEGMQETYGPHKVTLQNGKPVGEWAPGARIKWLDADGCEMVGVVRAVIDEEQRLYMVTCHVIGGGQVIYEVRADQAVEF